MARLPITLFLLLPLVSADFLDQKQSGFEAKVNGFLVQSLRIIDSLDKELPEADGKLKEYMDKEIDLQLEQIGLCQDFLSEIRADGMKIYEGDNQARYWKFLAQYRRIQMKSDRLLQELKLSF